MRWTRSTGSPAPSPPPPKKKAKKIRERSSQPLSILQISPTNLAGLISLHQSLVILISDIWTHMHVRAYTADHGRDQPDSAHTILNINILLRHFFAQPLFQTYKTAVLLSFTSVLSFYGNVLNGVLALHRLDRRLSDLLYIGGTCERGALFTVLRRGVFARPA